MKKLLIGIPTYNRPVIVEEWIEKQKDFLDEYNIDVVFWDSSENEATMQVVNRVIQQGYTLFSIHRVSSELDAETKALLLYENYEKSEYEYLWLMHDHTMYEKNFYKKLLEYLTTGRDFYILDCFANDYGNEVINDDINFLKYATHCGRFGSVVVSIPRFIENTDWKKIREKYWWDERHGWLHIGYYYERAIEIHNFSCEVVKFPFTSRHYMDPSGGKNRLAWYKKSICVAYGWYRVLSLLPDKYTNREEVMQQFAYLITKYRMLQLKKEGALKPELFLRYRVGLKAVNPADYIDNMLVSMLPLKVASKIVYHKLRKKVNEQKKRGKRVLIYGTGPLGEEYGLFLKEYGIPFDGFCDERKRDSFLEYPVEIIDEIKRDGNVFLLIAVSSLSLESVVKKIEQIEALNTSIEHEVIFNI